MGFNSPPPPPPAGLTKTDLTYALSNSAFTARTYGSGKDGATTLATSATLTLTRDMEFTTLVVGTAALLQTAGFKISCSVSLTNNGTINNDTGIQGHFLGGGARQTTLNTAGNPPPGNPVISGGSGGNGDYYIGGISVGYRGAANPTGDDLAMQLIGGGGGGAAGSVGIGGAGGGVVVLFAPTITNNGVLSARGVAGTGSGGGGGGGVVLLVDTVRTGNAPTVAGGAAAGVNGTAGLPGTIYEVIF